MCQNTVCSDSFDKTWKNPKTNQVEDISFKKKFACPYHFKQCGSDKAIVNLKLGEMQSMEVDPTSFDSDSICWYTFGRDNENNQKVSDSHLNLEIKSYNNVNIYVVPAYEFVHKQKRSIERVDMTNLNFTSSYKDLYLLILPNEDSESQFSAKFEVSYYKHYKGWSTAGEDPEIKVK